MSKSCVRSSSQTDMSEMAYYKLIKREPLVTLKPNKGIYYNPINQNTNITLIFKFSGMELNRTVREIAL